MSKIKMVAVTRLIEEAKDLLSDDGENPEYDRALKELIERVTGMESVVLVKINE